MPIERPPISPVGGFSCAPIPPFDPTIRVFSYYGNELFGVCSPAWRNNGRSPLCGAMSLVWGGKRGIALCPMSFALGIRGGEMKTTVKRIPWIAVAVIFLLCSPTSLWAVPIIEAEAYVASPPIGGSSIFWVDNDTVIFKGMPMRPASKEVSGERLLQFKVSQRKLTDLGSLGGGLCVSNGNIRYWRPTPETQDKPLSSQQSEWFAGSIGKETKVLPPPPKSEWIDETQGCKFNTELPPLPDWMEAAKKEGRLFKRLRPEHGWVELGSSQVKGSAWPKQYPIRLYRPGTNEAEGIEIRGVEAKDIDPIWTYYPFKNAYRLVELMRAGPPKEGIATGWWLHPDGRLEIAYQYDRSDTYDGIRTWGPLIPVRDGLLSAEWPYPKAKFSPGLYWFDPKGKHRLLVTGELGAWAVSPDGCKLAFGNENRLNSKGMAQTRLQVIDTCLDK